MHNDSKNNLAILGAIPVRKNVLPFYMPNINSNDIKTVLSALKRGMVSGNGVISRAVEEEISKITKSKYTFFTNSCTSALELALMASDIGHRDEVICPSFSFVSVANAILRQNAVPVFAEIDKHTFNIDVDSLKKMITSRTKAMIVVHYAGLPCHMDEIMRIARRQNLVVIEDAAQAMGSFYKGRHIGTIGDIGCISFHSTKNITCGEGGALITNNKKLAKKVEIIREKGTNRSAFMRKEVDRYTWIAVGSSFVQSDILAALLLSQLKKLRAVVSRHSHIAKYYNEKFERYADSLGLPATIPDVMPNWHIYAVLVNPSIRNWFIRALRAEGIEARFHFVPLHSSPFGRRLGYKRGDLPITEYLANAIIRLPIYYAMSKSDVQDVVIAVEKIVSHISL